MITVSRAQEILKNSKGKKILACGDVMLDAYLTGPVDRLSQEAPVPIIAVGEERFFPGGAGNAANCMATIGLRPHLISAIGKGEKINYGNILKEECKKAGIITHFISDPSRKTTLKMRLAAVKTTKQHVVRVDMEKTHPLDAKKEKEVISCLEKLFNKINPSVISIHDYKKGFLTKRIFQKICRLSSKHKIPVFADLKQDTFLKFRGLIEMPEIFFLKPNRIESVETAKTLKGFDKDGNTDEEITQIAEIIQKETPIQIVITRGKKGAVLFEFGKEPYFVRPKITEEQFDVAGAGDTVAAFLIAGYLGGVSMPEALELAVAASQVAIRKFGTSVVTKEELLNWVRNFFQDTISEKS